ncbi:hypothetical protein T11_16815 [Trichinella zimbabwensis]|uniref:Uncharacterized protein n=2 Tax=Trichinella TaxID=6333 RepID=A0A0V1MHX8_9BILA|nr:hypothetical protein T11_16815 [Trichinella zimbabwensis]KRZ71203.1 hypothetical protein T10_11557 [Trichinella papuae]
MLDSAFSSLDELAEFQRHLNALLADRNRLIDQIAAQGKRLCEHALANFYAAYEKMKKNIKM